MIKLFVGPKCHPNMRGQVGPLTSSIEFLYMKALERGQHGHVVLKSFGRPIFFRRVVIASFWRSLLSAFGNRCQMSTLDVSGPGLTKPVGTGPV